MIGLFIDSFPPIMDGVGLTAYNYAWWLQHSGQEVCVVTPNVRGKRLPEPFAVYRYPSMGVPRRKPYRCGLEYIPHPTMSRIKKLPLTIAHAHSPFSAGRLARSLAHKYQIPLVASFHTKFREDFKRYFHNDFVVNHILKQVASFFESADEVWVSQESVGEVLRSYGYRGETVVVQVGNDFAQNPNRAQWRMEKRKELDLDDETPLLLFVGQQIVEKNIPFLLDSLKHLHCPFKMIFIGDGYGLDSFRKQTEAYGLKEQVSFTGSIHSREELARYYAASDLFVFPSLYDTAGLVIREAAALQTPSLLIEGSTAAGAIQDNVNGFVAPPNPEAYARRIAQIVENRPLLQQVSLGAEETLARSWQDIAQEVNLRYQALIERKRYGAK